MTASPHVRLAPRVGIRPVTVDDLQFVHEIDRVPMDQSRWRHAAGAGAPQDYVRSLWNGVLEQSIIFARKTGEPLGLVSAYKANLRSGTVWVAVIAREHGPHALTGFALLVTKLFDEWPLRAVFVESLEANLATFASVVDTRTVEVVGRLGRHHRTGAESHDLVLLRIERDRWRDGLGALLRTRQAGAALHWSTLSPELFGRCRA